MMFNLAKINAWNMLMAIIFAVFSLFCMGGFSSSVDSGMHMHMEQGMQMPSVNSITCADTSSSPASCVPTHNAFINSLQSPYESSLVLLSALVVFFILTLVLWSIGQVQNLKYVFWSRHRFKREIQKQNFLKWLSQFSKRDALVLSI